jgi:hypothetical protein
VLVEDRRNHALLASKTNWEALHLCRLGSALPGVGVNTRVQARMAAGRAAGGLLPSLQPAPQRLQVTDKMSESGVKSPGAGNAGLGRDLPDEGRPDREYWPLLVRFWVGSGGKAGPPGACGPRQNAPWAAGRKVVCRCQLGPGFNFWSRDIRR